MGDNIIKYTGCDRYGNDLQRGQIMSRFNMQVIGMDCAVKREKDPCYTTAKTVERNTIPMRRLQLQGHWTIDE